MDRYSTSQPLAIFKKIVTSALSHLNPASDSRATGAFKIKRLSKVNNNVNIF